VSIFGSGRKGEGKPGPVVPWSASLPAAAPFAYPASMGWGEDECLECKAPIPPRDDILPLCAPCARRTIENIRQRRLWTKRLSAMGAFPGAKTKRAERLRALGKMGVRATNDNGRKIVGV
jgi:hypothetical protein